MINWNNNHKKIDISGIKDKVKKSLKKMVIGGIIVGTIMSYSGIQAHAFNENEVLQSVTFTDEEFKESVEVVNSFDVDVVEQEDLLNVDYLELSNVSSLDDLGKTPNLEFLSIDNANISDVSKINDLQSLKTLKITNSNMDFTSLNDASNIDFLYLCNVNSNSFDSISKLSLLTNVIVIDCPNFTSSDFLNSNKRLQNITFENLSMNNIFLNDLKELNIVNMSSVNTSGILLPENVTQLSISHTNLKNYDFLNNVSNLKTLSLIQTNFKDTSYLSNMNQLLYLDLNNTYIDNIDNIPNSIVSLNVSNCTNINSLENVKNFNNLTAFIAYNMDYLINDSIYNHLNNNNISIGMSSTNDNYKAQIDQILSNIITPEMDEYEKARAICDYVVNNVKYTDIKNPQDYNNQISLSLKGEAVCTGYSLLTQILGKEAGLDIYNVEGKAGVNHSWNMIKIDDNWYHLDTTWMDSNQGDKYFLTLVDGNKEKSFDDGRTILKMPEINSGFGFADTNNSVLTKWKNKGIINGYDDGTFCPNNNITNAQAFHIITNMLKLGDSNIILNNLNPDSWYYNSLCKVVESGIIKSDEEINPEEFLKTGQFESIIQEIKGDKKEFENSNADAVLTRADFINYLDKEIDYYINNPGTYYINGKTVVVASDGVTLKGNVDNLILAGNVINKPDLSKAIINNTIDYSLSMNSLGKTL